MTSNEIHPSLVAPEGLKEAVVALREAVKLNPSDYQAWITLGKTQFALGYFADAIKSTQEAESCDPLAQDFAQIQTAMQSRAFVEAKDIAIRMLQNHTGHPRAVFTLSHLFQMQGRHEEQAAILEDGLFYSPANTMLRHILVGAFEDCGEYEAAIKTAKHLVEIQPDWTALFTLMRVYMRYGFNRDLLDISEKALVECGSDKAKQSEIELLRGHALRTLGRRGDAISSYQACIANKPDSAAAWWALADLKTYQFSQLEEQSLKDLCSRSQMNSQQKTQAQFARAKAVEQGDGLEKAMPLYKAANASHPRGNFNADQFSKAIDSVIAAYNVTTLAHQAAPKSFGATPIFIVGLPRSGSTLVEQILASHSKIEGTMELPVLPAIKRKVHIECMTRFGGSYLHKLGDIPPADLEGFGRLYLKNTAMFRRENTPYFTDKLPHNFEHIGLIQKILPQAIIIDARRHPMDCGLSLFKQFFARGSDFSYDQKDIGAFYNGYLKMMDHWDEVLPNKVLCAQYEALIQNPRKQIEMILTHVGLDFEENCLRFHENKRAVRTASSEQVRRPLSSQNISVWKTVEHELEALKEGLGIETLARWA